VYRYLSLFENLSLIYSFNNIRIQKQKRTRENAFYPRRKCQNKILIKNKGDLYFEIILILGEHSEITFFQILVELNHKMKVNLSNFSIQIDGIGARVRNNL